MIDMSRMPASDMFSVRGIGVAVMVSTSTRLRICLMRSLCATPKRCSSSTTSRPRSRNCTSFESSRWVPTMISTLPSLRSSSVCFCSRLGPEPADHVDAHRKRREPVPQRLQVLKREHGRRREKRDLLAVHDRLERGAHRHFGLAVSDVAAQQPVHRRGRLHVPLDVGDGVRLIGGQLPLEGVFEFLLPVRIGGEGIAGHRLARGVELQQLLRHVAHGFLDAGLGLLPRGAAELVERRARRAGVLLDQVQPLDRNEELVLAGVAELHELLRRQADVDPLQADEHADAVVDVHDEVVDLQVAEVREERARRGAPPLVRLALFLEDVGLGPELERRHRAAGIRATDGRRRRAPRRVRTSSAPSIGAA